MESFYSKGYVCYLRARKMNDIIEKSIHKRKAIMSLRRIAAAYEKVQCEYNHSSHTNYDGLKVHALLFSNEMIISFVSSADKGFQESDLLYVIDDIRRLIAYFAAEGVTLEGGVSYGELYISGNINIGPAIVKAVLIKPKGESGVWMDTEIMKYIESKDAFSDCFVGTKLKEG